MIIQWGHEPTTSSGYLTSVTFPIAYSNVPIVVVSSRGVNQEDYGSTHLGHVQTTVSGFGVDTNSGSSTKFRLDWMSIGY